MAKIIVDMKVVDEAGKDIAAPFHLEIPNADEKQVENFIDAASEFGAKCQKKLIADKKK